MKKKVATACVLGTAVVLLFQMSNPSAILSVLLLAAMYLSGTYTIRQVTAVDVTVALLWLYEAVQCFATINETATVSAFRFSIFLLMTYVVLRKTLGNAKCYTFFLHALLVLCGIAVIIALLSFGIFHRSATEAGFADTYSLRFLFRPLGYNTNAWATVLFAIMGCTLLAHPQGNTGKNLRLSLWGILWLATLLSFSRAAFLMLGMVFLLLFLMKDTWTEKLKLIMIALMSVGVTVVCFPKETTATLRMNCTTSQQRSTQGRVNSAQAAWKVFSERKMLGAGAGNYIQAIDKEHFQDSNQSYSGVAPNWIIWALVEKGIVGTALYGVLLLAVCITVWKGGKKRDCLLAGIALAILLMKEMTLMTAAVTPMTAFMLCTLLAILQKDKAIKVFRSTQNNAPLHHWLTGSSLAVCLCMQCYFHRFEECAKKTEQAYIASENGRTDEAISLLESVDTDIPLLINRGRLYMKNGQYEQAISTLAEAKERQPEDVYIRFMHICALLSTYERENGLKELEAMVKRYPENALYRYEWFRQLYQDGKREEAMDALEKAILITPRILLLEQTEQLKKTDSLFYRTLTKRLMHSPGDKKLTALEKARQGFILYHCGKQEQAAGLLKETVEELPNLSTPWLLLGKYKESIGNERGAEECRKKYQLLTYGAFQPKGHRVVEADLELTQETELWKNYSMKFHGWYGHRLIF